MQVIIFEHSKRRKLMCNVCVRFKFITRDKVTNHCRQIDTHYSQKLLEEVVIGRQCETCEIPSI